MTGARIGEQTLDDVVGHERARRFLTNALAHGRVSHAYLFTGPARVGKTTLALAFAWSLLCQRPGQRRQAEPGGDPGERPAGAAGGYLPCRACASCRMILGGAHPDLQLLKREPNERGRETKNISTEQVERLRHDVGLAPFVGNRKVYAISNAEDLSIAAMNALLKTLEEPPPGVSLLLTSSEPALLLPTIKSRCQTLTLGPVEPDDIAGALVRRGADAERAELLAHLAAGRAGWAFVALKDEEVIHQRDAELTNLVGLASASRVDRLAYAEALAALNGKDPEQLRRRLGLWLGWWRDLALVRAGCEDLVVNVDKRAQLAEQSERFTLGQLRQFVADIDLAVRRLSQNVNARMALDVLLLAVPRP